MTSGWRQEGAQRKRGGRGMNKNFLIRCHKVEGQTAQTFHNSLNLKSNISVKRPEHFLGCILAELLEKQETIVMVQKRSINSQLVTFEIKPSLSSAFNENAHPGHEKWTPIQTREGTSI